MRIDILSCVPELLVSPLNHSILKRAQEKKILEVFIHNLRDYTTDKHRTVDDYPYGGGPGMVLMAPPLAAAIKSLSQNIHYDEIIYLTPDGETFNQKMANQLSLKKNLLLIAGHYKGIDQRIRDKYVTKEISIGDYVLSGGELPALVLVDAIGRLIPGVLGDETSALSDSFQNLLLDAPCYTRPAIFENLRVPEILLSGNHEKIEEWRLQQSIEKTKSRRPDLYHEWEKSMLL
jgi:tRNA (guanine37-N1)-methyltransferase